MQEQLSFVGPVKRSAAKLCGPCPPGVTPGPVAFSWPAAVRRVWRRPEQIAVSEWCARHRIMGDDGAHPGPWKVEVSLYLRDMMDALALPFVREVVCCAPPQTGKTEIMLCFLAYVSDMAPGPALMVYSVQSIARKMCTGRVRAMYNLSPRLRPLLTGYADDLSNFAVKLKNMDIEFAWATSISELSNRNVRYLFLDEVDKYESTNTKEAGPVSLARKRTRTYRHTSKIIMASSPSTEEGEVWLALSRTQARFQFAVRCPDCGHVHVMHFSPQDGKGGVRWTEGERDAERIQAERLATYACPACGSVWDDYKRDRAVRGGHWFEPETHMEAMAYLRKYRPRSVGFQYNTLIAPDVSLSETAGKFVLASQDLKAGRIDAYKDWLNGYMAEPWKPDFSPRKEKSILVLRDERPAGLLPSGGKVAALLAAVDTQDFGFWYEVRAWGYGQMCESWQVRAGFVENFDALDDVLWIPYLDADGQQHFVRLAGIDFQGHRGREVYDWCLLNRGRTVPIRGEQRMKDPFALIRSEVFPGTDKKIPGGLGRLHVNTKYYKDALHRKLSIPPTDPGAWHMNSECSLEWAKQLCVEYTDDLGNWVCPKGKANHAFDVSVYSFCLADFIGTRFMLGDAPLDDDEGTVEDERRVSNRPARW